MSAEQGTHHIELKIPSQLVFLGVPDAILMDIRLPDIDGIEVCHRLRDDPTLAHIPVIFLSANINDVARNEAAGVGAVACIAKPYEIRAVIAAIEAATDTTACEA